MVWSFPVEDGTYTVNLYFAEIFNGVDAAGERVFDVAVEGSVPAAFDNVDAFASAGAAGGFMRSATITVTDGALTLEFLRGLQNPDVSAIEIIVADEPPANVAPVIAAIADISLNEGQSASFAVSASDGDADPLDLSVVVTRNSDGAVVNPADYVFTDNGNGTGSFAWVTDSADAGIYTATVTADDGTATDTETVGITVADVPVGGSNTLLIRAGGTGTAALPPQFEVLVDGVSLGITSITTPLAGSFNPALDANYQNYSFNFAGAAPGNVSIRYFNDGTSTGIDRNLFVDYINLNGTVYESETAGFFTTLNPANQAALGGAREGFYVNGTLGFSGLPTTGGNVAPVIAAIADISLNEGQSASFAVSASDGDADPLDLSVVVTRNSDGAVVNPADYVFTDNGNGTGSFAWATDSADAGVYTATVTADDGTATDTETVGITVADVPVGGSNTLLIRAGGTGTAALPPQFEVLVDGVSLGITSITTPLAGSFNPALDANYQNYSFNFTGAAPGNVSIRYFNDGTSSGIDRNLFVDYINLNGTVYESETAGFFTTLNPANQAALGGAREGFYVNGTLGFSGLPTTGGNVAPVIAAIADISLNEGQSASFAVSASDGDADPLDLSVVVTRNSNGAVVNPADYVFTDNGNGTGSFAWATDSADAGVYTATVTADDGTATDTETVGITVADVPVGGSNTLLIRAGGTGTAALPPQFEVLVDGVSLGITSITTPLAGSFNPALDANYQNYSFNFTGAAPGTVSIRYFNDGTSSGIDRNLFVDYINLNGTVYESETAGFYTTLNPVNQAALGGAREGFYVNGTLAFDDLPDFLI